MAGLYVCSMKEIYAKRTQGREEKSKRGKEKKRKKGRDGEREGFVSKWFGLLLDHRKSLVSFVVLIC